MPISVECRTCGVKLRVKDLFAGQLVRCPQCRMGISIPARSDPSGAVEELDLDLDAELPRLPARKKKKPRPTTTDDIDVDLEFVEDGPEEMDEALPRLPPRRKKKKKPVVDEEVPRPVRLEARGDFLVWIFLLALLPLAVSVVIPEVPLEQRVQKSIVNDAAKQDDLEQYGAQEFLLIHDDFTLADAHLPRRSDLHWLYALVATGVFWALLYFMRYSTNVGPWSLLLAGLFTGTIGILMLLVFQVIAQIAMHIHFVGVGVGALILIVIKFIGFSYRSALDPNSGFVLSFIGFTCGVGFCEEICKAAPVFFYLRNTRKSDWRGTTLLGFASGAGFGISEGIMYAGSFYNGIEPVTAYLVRFASCVALHCILSGGVALLMFGNQEYVDGDCDWIPFLFGGMQYILIAMVLHGLYDTLLKQHLNFVGLLVALVSFAWLAWLSRYYCSYAPDETE